MWHRGSGQLVRMLASGEGNLTALDMSPCGRWLIIAGPDRHVTVLEWPSGRVMAELDSFPGGVMAACFTPDGDHIVVGQGRLWAKERSLELWNWRKKTRKRIFFAHRQENLEAGLGQVGGVVVSSDGRWLVAGVGNRLCWWNLGNGLLELETPAHGWAVTALAISPNGEWLISGGCDRSVRMWRGLATKPEREWRGFRLWSTGCVTDLAIASHGHWFVAACDCVVELRNLELEEAPLGSWQSPDPHNGKICGIAFAPDGKTWVNAQGGGWEQRDQHRVIGKGTTTTPHPIAGIQMHGAVLRVVTDNGAVAQWDLQQGLLDVVPAPDEPQVNPVLTTCGRWLLTVPYGIGAPRLTGLETGTTHVLSLDPYGNYNRTACCRDWAIVVNTRKRLLLRVDPETKHVETVITGMQRISSLGATPWTNQILLGDFQQGCLGLWDLDSLQKTGELPFEHDILAVFTLAPDGRFILASTGKAARETLTLLDGKTGAALRKFAVAPHIRITALAFSPDGGSFVTGNEAGQTLLWTMDGTDPLALWKGDGRATEVVGFTADGQGVLSGGESLVLRQREDGAEWVRLYLMENAQWVVTDPTGCFAASPGGMKFITVVQGMEPQPQSPETTVCCDQGILSWPRMVPPLHNDQK
ncbi:MAG: WD40 repeat domain-containing protein [Magnetococcus sp. WYHC-3]